MARVARFNVTPLKSTSLHHPDSVELTELGVDGDHRFMVIEADGRRLSGAAKAPLLGLRAEHDPDENTLAVTFPDGSRVCTDARPAGEPFTIGLYHRKAPAQEVPGPLAQAMSRHLERPVRIARIVEPEHAGGIHRASMISAATVHDLGHRGGAEVPPDTRRFRMLIELEDCEAYEEDTWMGGRVRAGGAILRVGNPVPRCVLTDLDPDSGERDFPTLAVLAGYRRAGTQVVLGVFADVEEPGMVAVGDAIEPL